jgi:glycosyltransferase involved in cell wall biosynthesis
MKQIRTYPAILSVIVPVYNEAKAMADLLPIWIPYCQKKNWTLILINDGSFDDTAKILGCYAGEKNVIVINHKLNRGYGGAIKSGIFKATTRFVVTIDGDGQHNIDDIDKLLAFALEKDADMIVGSRSIYRDTSWYRALGKWIIRKFTSFLMPLPIYDLNSGFKLYRTDLAKKFIHMCPDSMAYSDIVTLMYINQRHLVLEYPISINERMAGTSTINTYTAFETVIEILNLAMLFNPLRIFLPLSVFCIVVGLGWGTPFVLSGKGVSVGSMLAIVIGILFFFLGLIASQLSALRIGSLAQDEKFIEDQLTILRGKK